VLATRVLGEAEYAAWAEEHAAAAGSLDDREQRVAAARGPGDAPPPSRMPAPLVAARHGRGN